MKMTGGQIVVEHLIREGVDTVFAIPGHGNTALLDACVERADELRVIPAMHEQGAAHMADAYYRASGRLAAAITSIGPGATNTMTGLATAFADSCPFLLITGGVHTYMHNAGVLQEIDRPHGANFPAMAEPVVKRWWQPIRIEDIATAMAQAFNAMLDGRRGPVLIDLPQDLQAEFGEYDPETFAIRRTSGRPRPDADLVAAAADLLVRAERPVVLAGGGVIHAEASAELLAVAEHLGAPMTHTFNGKSAVPADHPLFAWPCGDMGSIPGNAMTTTADVILAVGCRFSDRITSSYRTGVTFDIPGVSKLVQLDIDGFEIGRNYPAEVGLVADARAGLQDLLAALQERGPAKDYASTPYFEELQQHKREWLEHLEPARTTDHLPMTNSRVIVEMRAAMPRDGVLVTDSSNPANQAFNEFESYEPRADIVCGGMSGIGWGVPAAVGVQFAVPDKPVVCFVGDGSFLQSGTEVATAAMYDLPIVFVVSNNGGWEAIRDLQTRLFGDGRNVSTDWRRRGEPYFADIAGMARALGCVARRIDDPTEVRGAVAEALADRTQGPVVLEVMTATSLPWAKMHPTGWWDITVPAYLGETREDYVAQRGF